jgi:hypothetical protein
MLEKIKIFIVCSWPEVTVVDKVNGTVIFKYFLKNDLAETPTNTSIPVLAVYVYVLILVMDEVMGLCEFFLFLLLFIFCFEVLYLSATMNFSPSVDCSSKYLNILKQTECSTEGDQVSHFVYFVAWEGEGEDLCPGISISLRLWMERQICKLELERSEVASLSGRMVKYLHDFT